MPEQKTQKEQKEQKTPICADFGGRNADGTPCRKRVLSARCFAHADAPEPDPDLKPERGRPRLELSGTERDLVERLAAFLTQDQIARALGIGEKTFRRRLAEDPELRAAYDRGRAMGVANVAQSLITQALNGNVAAAIFYLKAQAGWSEKSVVEHRGTLTLEAWLRSLPESDLRRLQLLNDEDLLKEFERARADYDRS